MTATTKPVATSLAQIKTRHPKVQGIIQHHAIELLEPVQTVSGEVLPAGTVVSILSGGNYGVRRAVCVSSSVWGDGRQHHIYSE